MRNALNLDPEWGAIDLVEEIEATFNIKIADSDAERCLTVGDVFDVLCKYVSEWDDQDGTCSSSMIFYRFRRALDEGDKRNVFPVKPLDAFGRQPKLLLEHLTSETGLRLPAGGYARLGVTGSFLLAGGTIASIVVLLTGHWIISAAALIVALTGIPLIRWDPGLFPAGVETVGDLVRRTVPLNVEQLRAEGGRPSDRWSVLVALAAEHGTLPASEISPESFLHQASFKKGAG